MMQTVIRGNIYEHKKTKKLLHYLPQQSIVFLWHEDLDGVTVDGLKKANVKAVINGKQSFSGKYTHDHVSTLLEAHIPVFDVVYVNKNKQYDGEHCFIYNYQLFVIEEGRPKYVAHLIPYTKKLLQQKHVRAKLYYAKKFEQFVDNTVTYVKNEYEWFQTKPYLPPSLHEIDGKDVFIVARNKGYEKDIRVLRPSLRKRTSSSSQLMERRMACSPMAYVHILLLVIWIRLAIER